LAVLEFDSLAAFFITAFFYMCCHFAISLLLAYYKHILFAQSVNLLESLSFSNGSVALSIVNTDFAVPPESGQLDPKSLPALLFGNLSKNEVQRPLPILSSHFYSFEIDLGDDFVRFVEEGDVEAFYFDAPVSVL
jgi:hypothetical protein